MVIILFIASSLSILLKMVIFIIDYKTFNSFGLLATSCIQLLLLSSRKYPCLILILYASSVCVVSVLSADIGGNNISVSNKISFFFFWQMDRIRSLKICSKESVRLPLLVQKKKKGPILSCPSVFFLPLNFSDLRPMQFCQSCKIKFTLFNSSTQMLYSNGEWLFT